MNTLRTLSREVNATQIPSGEKTSLPAGTRITISQTLGGTYTVSTDFGLFRIDGKDADALGEAVTGTAVQAAKLNEKAGFHKKSNNLNKVFFVGGGRMRAVRAIKRKQDG